MLNQWVGFLKIDLIFALRSGMIYASLKVKTTHNGSVFWKYRLNFIQ
jgi:hypothetical protein